MRRLGRFLPRPSFQKPGGSWRSGSIYGKNAKRRSPRRVARKRNPVPTGRREGHTASPLVRTHPRRQRASKWRRRFSLRAGLCQGRRETRGWKQLRQEAVGSPRRRPGLGDRAPGSGLAQLHALVARTSRRPLADDGPEFCRGRNVCFILLGSPDKPDTIYCTVWPGQRRVW